MTETPDSPPSDTKIVESVSLDVGFYSEVEGTVLPNADPVPVTMPPSSEAVHGMVVEKEYDERNPFNARYEILSKASTQALDDTFEYGTGLTDEVVEPLYNMDQLTVLNDISVIRSKCIEAMAAYTVGLGYRIKKIDPNAETVDSDRVSELIREQLESWASRDERTFTELMQAVKYDEETTGNAFVEVSRNRKGEIDGLYHVPSHTIRIRRDRAGYVQQRGSKKVPFYRFGDKVQLFDDNTIRLLENRDPQINELIHFKLYSARSSYYGAPRDVSAIVTIAGDEMARNHNIKFFTHSATPEICLVFEQSVSSLPTISGDQPVKVNIPEATKRQIVQHFRKNLAAKTFEPGMFFLPSGVSLKIEKISQGQRDSGWTKYRDANRAEVRMAFRTPPVIVGDTAGSGYATAAIEKQVYQEGVIGPEQTRYEQRLMGLLWPEFTMITQNLLAPKVEEDGSLAAPVKIKPDKSSGVDPDVWLLEFKEMAIADQAVAAANHQIYGTMGTITKNEIRADIGRRPIEGGDEPPTPPESGGEGPDPKDIRGLAGRAGGGRGPNGTVTPGLPRRPFEQTPQTPANLTTVGNPMSKRDDGDPIELSDEELIEEVVSGEQTDETLEELQDRLESDPELLEKFQDEYLGAVEQAFQEFADDQNG
jgi:PBSX family phage portal protein